MSKPIPESMHKFFQKAISDKLNHHGFSDVRVKVALVGDQKFPLFVVEIKAIRPSGTKFREIYCHSTMTMWSAKDLADCFSGIAIRDKNIYPEYKDKRIPSMKYLKA